MNEVTSVMIVGVGGQGTLLSSRLLGSVCLRADVDVKVSEVHGMSQRGGSVVTHVRYGQKVYSPIIEQGSADYIVGFEKLEAARFLPWLREGGKVIVNTAELEPMPVIMGATDYPEDIVEKIRDKGIDIRAVDAFEIARKAGNVKALNVVLMGVLSRELEFPKELWLEVLERTVPKELLQVNLRAFEMGRNE